MTLPPEAGSHPSLSWLPAGPEDDRSSAKKTATRPDRAESHYSGRPMTTSPTRARYRVVALATGLGMITYLDRACIATLAPGIIRELALSTVQMGYVFTV